ncbi:MAG: hypothetical protein M9947_18105 [Thermomicrobiales bacterium]|nr:hypothetical protein [Thermomicrobiales bacterium]
MIANDHQPVELSIPAASDAPRPVIAPTIETASEIAAGTSEEKRNDLGRSAPLAYRAVDIREKPRWLIAQDSNDAINRMLDRSFLCHATLLCRISAPRQPRGISLSGFRNASNRRLVSVDFAGLLI